MAAGGVRSRAVLLVAATAPALLALLLGLLHPPHLTDGSAAPWRDLHLVLLPVFPAMGFAPWLLARTAGRWWGVAAAVGGYLFSVFYTALDVLAGIGAGTVVLADEPDARAGLFRIANQLAVVGVVGFAAAFAIAAIGIAAVRTRDAAAEHDAGRRALAAGGGVLAVVGAALILPGHIWFPVGTAALALVIAGTVLLALAAPDRRTLSAM